MAKTISYDKLWKLLIDKKLNRTELKEKSGISTASLAKLGKCENLTTAVILKICCALECNISDIMDVIDDPRKDKELAIKKQKIINH
jgi:putative transcriptional regulator